MRRYPHCLESVVVLVVVVLSLLPNNVQEIVVSSICLVTPVMGLVCNWNIYEAVVYCTKRPRLPTKVQILGTATTIS